MQRSSRLMKRLLCATVLASALLVAPLSIRADENSTLQMLLMNSARFQMRVQYLAWDYASTILGEALLTACHSARITLALEVIAGGSAQKVSLGISRSNAGGRVILGTVVDGANGTAITNATPESTLAGVDKAKVDSSATDLALASAITFYWNSIAKCQTGV